MTHTELIHTERDDMTHEQLKKVDARLDAERGITKPNTPDENELMTFLTLVMDTSRLKGYNNTADALDESIRKIRDLIRERDEARQIADRRLESLRRVREYHAKLITDYFNREISTLMHQADHWAKEGKPLAVHHRLATADSYFQVVTLFDLATKNSDRYDPFEQMRKVLEAPRVGPEGKYPPPRHLSKFYDPRFVCEVEGQGRNDLYNQIVTALDVQDMWHNPDTFHEAADKIDCGGGCPYLIHDHDVNYMNCSKAEEDGYCPYNVAETLRAIGRVAKGADGREVSSSLAARASAVDQE